tara:strand:- start:6626 stop:6895 length:270 start_codon:yes stop_codon:yes gene_type:complete
MEGDIKKLDSLVLKQAIRDLASKNLTVSNNALTYFKSNDFSNFCTRNNIQKNKIMESVKELKKFPLLSRKRLSNNIAKLIDEEFDLGSS